jgi:hypothetical protein
MRMLPRPDQPDKVMELAGKYPHGVALIVLGGPSAAGWEELRDRIQPDVILGANGVNSMIQGLDVWICSENMNYTSRLAASGDARGIEYMEMFHREAGAKIKLISHRSWNLLKDTSNCISIRRIGYEADQVPADFSYRVYGDGFMSGWIYDNFRYMRLRQRVGNAGCQLLHMASILGCTEIFTIGFDMLFRAADHHHAYDYPIYKVDRFRNPANFVKYKGQDTQEIWIACARFLATMEPYLERAGIRWVDHSDGLLKLMGLRCANDL